MAIDDYEQSAYDGQPQQLFLFHVGDDPYAYTNAAAPYTYNSISYTPMAVRMDDIRQSLSEGAETLQIRIDSTSQIAQMFVPYMPHQPVKVRVYRFHRGDNEYATELIGEVTNGNIDQDTDECVLSVRMVASDIDRNVPWPVFQKQCNNVLGGPQCRVNLDLYRVETVITGVPGIQVSSPDFEVGDPTYFVAGWVTNLRTNERRWVVAQDGPVLTLQTPFVDARGGDPIEAVAGCDLLKATCEAKFNNLPRFWGWGNIPNKNPFRDNIFGTGTSASSGGGGTVRNASNGWGAANYVRTV